MIFHSLLHFSFSLSVGVGVALSKLLKLMMSAPPLLDAGSLAAVEVGHMLGFRHAQRRKGLRMGISLSLLF